MPSSRRSPKPSSEHKGSKEPPEILHHVGRAVLAYTLKKLSERQAQSSNTRSRTSHRKSSRSKTRDPSSASKRGSSRDLPRSDSGDMHALVSQLVVGAFAFGIRTLIRRRREAKKKKAEAAAAAADAATLSPQAGARSVARGKSNPGQDAGAASVDPELSAALDSVTTELQSASDSIRRLASSAPSVSHRNCAVRDALLTDADRLSGSLANMQASINNMRNLHPGLVQEKGRKERARERAKERAKEKAKARKQTEGRVKDWVRERQRERATNGAIDRNGGEVPTTEGMAMNRGLEPPGQGSRSGIHRRHREHDRNHDKPEEERHRHRRNRRGDEGAQRDRRSEPVPR
ncbi:hypothetical protein C7999DRAFT_43721 [Corynascus novoguineensis]|uniref:Uncharacterized protein n=1 Tax=Corynascus novoguineensis TaxID=1126955 RepID=A0AAN7CMT8_9PEZI|nr:hypothetical protein C7999DRAFT_43721 [Corynascus novoguineensis]